MNSPSFGKTLFWIALLAVAAFFGVKYLKENPHAADFQKVQPGVYQPQPADPNGNSGRIVVVP